MLQTSSRNIFIRFRNDVSLHLLSPQETTLRTYTSAYNLRTLSPSTYHYLKQLEEPQHQGRFFSDISSHLSKSESLLTLHHLANLKSRGLLSYLLRDRGCTLATLSSMETTAAIEPMNLDTPTGSTYHLSPLTVIRPRDNALIAENPLSKRWIEIGHEDTFTLLAQFSNPQCLPITATSHRQPIASSIDTLVSFFLAARIIEPFDHQTSSPNTSCGWELHDAMMHFWSKRNDGHHRSGSTTRSLNTLAKPPMHKQPAQGATTLLVRSADDRAHKVSLADALSSRRSIREHLSTDPITINALGVLLEHSAMDASYARLNDTPSEYEYVYRSYPSPGACHSLEIYITVNSCVGLPRGIYWYSPRMHSLENIGTPDASDALIEEARIAMHAIERPQIVLIITSRFRRVSWKYQGISYALTLQSAGALIQNLYLVATALDLAPCALGFNDSGLFATTTNIPPLEEGPVASFALGSRRSN